MAASTPSMDLREWNFETDDYNHDQLVGNWSKLDQHDHSPGRGVPVTTGGIADGAISTSKIATGAVTMPTLGADVLSRFDADESNIADNTANIAAADARLTTDETAITALQGSYPAGLAVRASLGIERQAWFTGLAIPTGNDPTKVVLSSGVGQGLEGYIKATNPGGPEPFFVAPNTSFGGFAAFYLNPADFNVSGRTAYLQMRAALQCSDAAAGQDIHISIFPIVGTSNWIATPLGTEIVGTTFTSPPNNSPIYVQDSASIAFPSAGWYVISAYAGGGALNSSCLISTSAWLSYHY